MKRNVFTAACAAFKTYVRGLPCLNTRIFDIDEFLFSPEIQYRQGGVKGEMPPCPTF